MHVNFLVLCYRGFGRSDGEPSQEGVRMDSQVRPRPPPLTASPQAALDFLLSHPDVHKRKIVLYGHSLGASVALHLAADNPDKVAAVIVENAFLKLVRSARLPVRTDRQARVIFGNRHLSAAVEPLLLDPWNNEKQADRLVKLSSVGERVPHILLLAGLNDRMVPPWHTDLLWERIQRLRASPSLVAALHQFADGPHTCHAQPGYHHRIKSFIDEAVAR